jgi:hypothetical protein
MKQEDGLPKTIDPPQKLKKRNVPPQATLGGLIMEEQIY